MSTINDLWKSYLEGEGYTFSSVQDTLRAALLVETGLSSGTPDELWKAYLTGEGYDGTVQDMMKKWLAAKGYDGSMQDMLKKALLAGNIFLSPLTILGSAPPPYPITLSGDIAASLGAQPMTVAGNTASATQTSPLAEWAASTDPDSPFLPPSSGMNVVEIKFVKTGTMILQAALLAGSNFVSVTKVANGDVQVAYDIGAGAVIIETIPAAQNPKIALGMGAGGSFEIYKNGVPYSIPSNTAASSGAYIRAYAYSVNAGDFGSIEYVTSAADTTEAYPAGVNDWGGNSPRSLVAWYTSKPADLYLTSAGVTNVAAAGEPVGLRINKVSGGPNAAQATLSARPIWDGEKLIYDGSNDALVVTVPTGGWSGSFFQSTSGGVIKGTFSRPAGAYQIPTNAGYSASVNNDLGLLLCDGTVTESERDQIVAYLKAQGAGNGVYTGSWINRFRGRTDITSLDFSGDDTSGVNNFNSTWFGCTGLTSFPLLDVSGATIFTNAWYGCSSLTSFPLLNVSSGTNFTSTWEGCTGLTSFPILDVSSGTTFNNTWYGCTGLTSFPLLNVSSGTNFSSAWRGCTGLTSFPANFFDGSTATNFTNAFFATNLSQTSIDNILVSINSNGTSNGTFTQSGGSAPSATGEAAITAMRGRGWTVTVTGGF